MALFQLPLADRLARARDFALIDRLWRTWSPGARLDADARAALHACLAASWPAPLAPYRAMVRPLAASRDRARRANRPLTTPLRYLHGADDGCISPAVARGQERWMRGPLVVEVVPGAGHFLQVEVPDLVVDRVDDWIARHGNR
jgi:pimeloyl-ACP methyl ester carboxylesterase